MRLYLELHSLHLLDPLRHFLGDDVALSRVLAAGGLGAWGVLPAQYDKKREGGSNVVGEWKRENGLLKLSFRKFKGVDQKDEDKKLWQFIGKGATTPDDYYSWSDYLKYLRASDQFVLVKRTDGQITYLPASKEGDYPRLFPEKFVLKMELIQ